MGVIPMPLQVKVKRIAGEHAMGRRLVTALINLPRYKKKGIMCEISLHFCVRSTIESI